jgi:hypothetical protein
MAGGSGRAARSRSSWPPPRGAGASPSAARSCKCRPSRPREPFVAKEAQVRELDLPHETSTTGSFPACGMRSASVGRQIGVGVAPTALSSCAARTGRPKSAPPSACLHTKIGRQHVRPTSRRPMHTCGSNLTAAKRSCRHKRSSSQATLVAARTDARGGCRF